jgi:hypothetical protein
MKDRSNHMQATIDLSVVFTDHMPCDLRVMCGPRYNSFGPAVARREEAGKFFEKSAWRALAKRAGDDESDWWDGLE